MYAYIYNRARSPGHDKVQLFGKDVSFTEVQYEVVLAHSAIKRIIDLSCSKKNVAFPRRADHSRSVHFFLMVLTQINAPQPLVLVCKFDTTTNHKRSEDDLIPVRKSGPYIHTYISPWTEHFLLYACDCARVFLLLCPNCQFIISSATMMDLTPCHQTACHTEITYGAAQTVAKYIKGFLENHVFFNLKKIWVSD